MSKISFIFTPFHKIILNYKRKRVIFQAIRWGNRLIRPTSQTNDSSSYFKILILIIDMNKHQASTPQVEVSRKTPSKHIVEQRNLETITILLIPKFFQLDDAFFSSFHHSPRSTVVEYRLYNFGVFLVDNFQLRSSRLP